MKRSTQKNGKKSNNENMGQTESRSKRVKVDVNLALNAGAWMQSLVRGLDPTCHN